MSLFHNTTSLPPLPSFPLCHLPDDILHIIISLLARSNHEVPANSLPQTPAVLDRRPLLALSATNQHLRSLCLPQILSSLHLGDAQNSPSALREPLAWIAAHPLLAAAHVRTLHVHGWYRSHATETTTARLEAREFSLGAGVVTATAETATTTRITADAGFGDRRWSSSLGSQPSAWQQRQPQAPSPIISPPLSSSDPHALTLQLARTLTSFRNLRTLRVTDSLFARDEAKAGTPEIGDVSSSGLLLLHDAVTSGKIPSFSLPSVTSLELGAHAEWLVAHCPNARRIATTGWESREDWEDAHSPSPSSLPSPSSPSEIPREEETYSPPSALISAAASAALHPCSRLARFELAGWFGESELSQVADTMPVLREVRLAGTEGMSWESVAGPLGRLRLLERLDVSKLQFHLLNGDWLRPGTWRALRTQVTREKGEGFVRMVFRSLPQLRSLEVEGVLRAECISAKGWEESAWNETARIRVVLNEEERGVEAYEVGLKEGGEVPMLYSVAKEENGGLHVEDVMTVA